jgi:hypothetical protein
VAENLYIVTIRWTKTLLTEENVEKIDDILNPLGNWLRFSGTTWILATDSSAMEIFHALSEFLHKDDSELIMRVDPDDYSGWAAKWVDEWLISKRKTQAMALPPPKKPPG